jgi:hypothetical protein
MRRERRDAAVARQVIPERGESFDRIWTGHDLAFTVCLSEKLRPSVSFACGSSSVRLGSSGRCCSNQDRSEGIGRGMVPYDYRS